MIGEVYLKTGEIALYYGAELGGLQLPTNFNLLWTPWKAEPILEVITAYEAALPPGAWPDWVMGNHDQSRIASRLGRAQARIAMVLLLTLRGTPILYYGDELGLQDIAITSTKLRDPFGLNMPGSGQGRDPERCPMPWDETEKAGFTTGDPWLPIAPDFTTRNVENQSSDAARCCRSIARSSPCGVKKRRSPSAAMRSSKRANICSPMGGAMASAVSSSRSISGVVSRSLKASRHRRAFSCRPIRPGKASLRLRTEAEPA